MQAVAVSKGIQKVKGLQELASKYQNFLFDLDGVVWVGNNPVNGAIESLAYLQSQNKRIFYITNNSTRNREEVQQRFKKFGLGI